MSALRSFFENLLGVYTPVTVDVDGVTVPLSGVAGVDWPYILTGICFIVVVYCTLRLLASFISRL